MTAVVPRTTSGPSRFTTPKTDQQLTLPKIRSQVACESRRVPRAVRGRKRGRDLDDKAEHGAEYAAIEKGGPEDNDGPGPDQVPDPTRQRTAASDRDAQRSAQQ
jgi:hypothetical protein